MINLASLSALIRTLRHTTGVDGPAAPAARVASIAPVAEDDAGAMNPTALRGAMQTRTTVPTELAEHAATDRDGVRDQATTLREASLRHIVSAATDARATTSAAAPAENTALELTALARLLQTALRGSASARPSAPTVTSSSPLALDIHASTAPVAEALSRAIAESGLFYESHLARVLQRDYPMAAVAREPQAAWPAPGHDGAATGTASASVLPEQAAALLSRQLDAFDTRAVMWVGDVWPGRPATIRFEELADPDDRAANDADVAAAPAPWQTRIVIELPLLGRVTAKVSLRGQSLDVTLGVPTHETAERLRIAREAFDAALADARLGLRSFDVALER